MILRIINSAFKKRKGKENSVFHPQLVEYADAKSRDMKGQLYIYWKNLHVSKPVSFKGQLYFEKPSFYQRMTIPVYLYQR